MTDVDSPACTVSDTVRTVLVTHLRRVPDDDWSTVALSDLGLDSMVAIEVVVEIEELFGTEFPEELLVRETFATFDSLEAAVRAMVGRL